MTTKALFDVTFVLAVPFWALMILLPAWSWTARIVRSPLIVLPPLSIYLVLLLRPPGTLFGDLWAAVSRPTLAGVHDVVGTLDGTALIWAHLIAFDLFIGRWMYFDSRERGIHPFVMAPVLVLTILLSPLGLLVYIGIRSFVRLRERAAVR